MKQLIQTIEKMKPHFEKISNNPYLRAIRDGFISLIPVILFSSFFLLAAYVPNAFGFHWDTSNRNDSNEGLQRINGYSRFAYGSYCDKKFDGDF